MTFNENPMSVQSSCLEYSLSEDYWGSANLLARSSNCKYICKCTVYLL